MQKGVSPVIAVTVLIMMAVLATAAVWYWVSSYTSAPALPDNAQKGYSVLNVYRNASSTGCHAVDIKNTGGLLLSNVMFEVRDYVSGRPAGANGSNPTIPAYVNITSGISAGTTAMANISAAGNASSRVSLPFGIYMLRISTRTPSTTPITGFTDQLFTCS